ncbi:tyrosine-protein phosphatase [Echinicola rosea]|uniref:Protein-tyrosine-phosphatase n=1 Tax=Echinicola rosea TaxID=1807691 RepID=A0ABQ1V3R1_9BACT|nr:tyrosine-protein phosphatase [Echinicola rosea]GGF37457.1 protein-tyrosine-phosphatase [Echinicola rosea]
MKTLKAIVTATALLTSISAQAQKNLGLEASPNFRELGGIETKDGKTVKDHMIYRSGSFTALPEGDKEKLAETGITTVIDFRSDYEIEREPDDIPASLNAEWINSSIGNIDPKSMQQFMKVLTGPSFSTDQVDSLMIAANKGFVDNITDFKPLFDHLMEKDEVVLFHCSAGKDRTGFASSLLLHALGADWDTIMADYLRSNEAVGKVDKSKLEMYGIPKERAEYMMGVKAPYLEAAWEGIREKYGDVDTMLEEELGIGKKEKKQLRKKYLSKN